MNRVSELDLSVGDEIEVTYASQRSGNEVSRTATVVKIIDDEIYAYDEAKGPLKHTFMNLGDAQTTEGDDCIAATTMTVDYSGMPDTPDMVRSYRVEPDLGYTSILGVVQDVS